MKKHQKTKLAFANYFLFKKSFLFLKIMPDRGFRNDMKQLSIVCSLCEWNGLFKDYEVQQSYFIRVVFFAIGVSITTNRILFRKCFN
jgi:hypothetical protein